MSANRVVAYTECLQRYLLMSVVMLTWLNSAGTLTSQFSLHLGAILIRCILVFKRLHELFVVLAERELFQNRTPCTINRVDIALHNTPYIIHICIKYKLNKKILSVLCTSASEITHYSYMALTSIHFVPLCSYVMLYLLGYDLPFSVLFLFGKGRWLHVNKGYTCWLLL